MDKNLVVSHINIRYFFVADWKWSGDLEITFRPTSEILADYFTKPLQGSLFKRFREIIMNVQVQYEPFKLSPMLKLKISPMLKLQMLQISCQYGS